MKLGQSHDKLVDFIEDAKERKFPPVEDDVGEYDDEFDIEAHDNVREGVRGASSFQFDDSKKISPDSHQAKRSLDEHFSGRNVRTKI